MRKKVVPFLVPLLVVVIGGCIQGSLSAIPATPVGPTNTSLPPLPPGLVPPSPLHPAWTSLGAGNQVKNLAFDAQGNLWAVMTVGVVKWNLADGTYTPYHTEDGLADNAVYLGAYLEDTP